MKDFRYIFVVEPGRDFSSLAKRCDQIRFVTSGYEEVSQLEVAISKGLRDLDPKQDAILAVGRVNSCLLTGAIVQGSANGQPWTIGIYTSDAPEPYKFIRVQVGNKS